MDGHKERWIDGSMVVFKAPVSDLVAGPVEAQWRSRGGCGRLWEVVQGCGRFGGLNRKSTGSSKGSCMHARAGKSTLSSGMHSDMHVHANVHVCMHSHACTHTQPCARARACTCARISAAPRAPAACARTLYGSVTVLLSAPRTRLGSSGSEPGGRALLRQYAAVWATCTKQGTCASAGAMGWGCAWRAKGMSVCMLRRGVMCWIAEQLAPSERPGPRALG
eukprot:166542-Chlamydomonas_euryale.AAC.3